MSGGALTLRGVRKVYGRGETAFEALHGVDLDVREGEILLLEGPSGSGKTTLLSIMGGVLLPTEGEVSLDGRPVPRRERQLADWRAGHVGFVFQGHHLLDAVSAEENVAFPLRLAGRSRQDAVGRARALLGAVGLEGHEGALPGQLSVGQRQRVALARALATSPPLVLADEPTASLDAASGERVADLLRDLSRERGATVVIVTHDVRLRRIADRVLRVEDGSLRPEDGGA